MMVKKIINITRIRKWRFLRNFFICAFSIVFCAGVTLAKDVPSSEKKALSSNDVPDGFASLNGGTTGGKAASSAHIYKISTRAEFINALKCGGSKLSDDAKIIYVTGMIDLSVDDNGKAVDGYWYLSRAGFSSVYDSWKAWCDAYAATCSGSSNGSGEPEQARKAAFNLEKNRVVFDIGSNTSIIGSGNSAGFKNGSLVISKKNNVIIRNVSVLDAYDWFASWDYKDGNVNSEFDTIAITNGSSNVWVDHCTLGDGSRPDSELDYVVIGGMKHKWVVHDGLLDVTKGSDFVTISYNKILNHNKTMLFGSSDSASGTDTGKLRITVHHNWFNNVTQRLPRVRFGQVHAYNNYYQDCGICIGVGDGSRIYSESNYFASCKKSFAKYDHPKNEGYFFDIGSNSTSGDESMATAALVGWTPSYPYTVDPNANVPKICQDYAGAGMPVR
jgi:pectate lyase